MPEEDPLAALSAAAKNRSAPSRVPRSPAPTPGRPVAGRVPGKPKQGSYLIPLFIGLGILAVGIPAGIIITLKLMQTEAPHREPSKGSAPGELFKNVPAQDMTPSKAPAEP